MRRVRPPSGLVRKRLAEVPELVQYVRVRREPGGAVRDGHPGAPSRTPPAPLHVGALDDADTIDVDLIGHVRRWGAALSIATVPVTLRNVWTVDGVPLGFRPSVTPPGAATLVHNLATWHLIRHDRITAHPGGPEYLYDVAQTIETMYTRFPLDSRPPRPHWRRPCPVCGMFAVTADWKADAEVRDVTVWCESCSHVIVSTTQNGDVRATTHPNGTPAQQIARIVRDLTTGAFPSWI